LSSLILCLCPNGFEYADSLGSVAALAFFVAVLVFIGYAPLFFFAIINVIGCWSWYSHWTLQLLILPYTLVKWVWQQLHGSYCSYKQWKGGESEKEE
jgi:hypothetical protein